MEKPMENLLPPAPAAEPRGKTARRIFIVVLLVAVFLLGLRLGRAGYVGPQNLVPTFIQRGQENAPKDVNWQLLWNTISQIQQKYVNRPVDLQKILYGAVGGAVAALEDPYSVFLPPQAAENFKNELQGSFEGIGAEIAVKNQVLTVVTPLDNSPAQKAGLKAGDFIYQIDGQDTKDLSVDQAVDKIRGPAGSTVTLSIVHKGATKPVAIKITRAKIEVKALSYEIKNDNGKKIGYLKLSRFDQDTPGEVNKAVTDFLNANVKGIIFDLRNDPGGFLDAAVAVSGNWVPANQTVVIQRFGDGRPDEDLTSKGAGRLQGIPTIVLINGGSASASEITAGALQDYGLAKLVGEKSFGKGSVQELIDLGSNAEVKLTVAKWLTPKGHDLNKEGLTPDVPVELTDQDFQNDRDPQLDKALQLLAP